MATEGNIESLSARHRGRDERIRTHVVRNAWDGDCLGIYVRVKLPSGAHAVGLPLTLQTMSEEEMYGISSPLTDTPTLSLRREEAQELMDELWRAGIRPADGTGSTGQLAATQAHLDDMRALVFKTGDPRIKPDARR